MSKKNLSNAVCPIARSLSCAGDTWSLLILRDAIAGLTRFDDFRKSLDIAPTMLTQRLAALTEEGLLERRQYSERPPREEYILTEAGRGFAPVLVMLGAWGGKYRCDGETTQLIDANTGLEIVPVVIDSVTGSKISDLSIRLAIPKSGS